MNSRSGNNKSLVYCPALVVIEERNMALLYQITTITEPAVDARIIIHIINSTYYIIEHQFEKLRIKNQLKIHLHNLISTQSANYRTV